MSDRTAGTWFLIVAFVVLACVGYFHANAPRLEERHVESAGMWVVLEASK